MADKMDQSEEVPLGFIEVEVGPDGVGEFPCQIPASVEEEPQQGTSKGQASDGEQEVTPALVARTVHHLVPVEQQDGRIVNYIFNIVSGEDDDAESELKIVKINPEEGDDGMPLNPGEFEGVFLDRDVEDPREIVVALQPRKPKKPTGDADGDKKKDEANKDKKDGEQENSEVSDSDLEIVWEDLKKPA